MAESDGRDRTFADAVTLGGFRLGALAARALPGLAAAALATPIGFGASTTNRDRRAMVERHLRRANPALDGLALRRAVQESFDSYARYWIESFRLPSLHKQVVDGGIKVSGYEHVAAGLDAGSGVILALPHLGGWEWAGRWRALRGVKITVVVERLDPPELFDWFVKLRSELGMTVVALGPDAGKAVLGALKRNEVVCLLSDRDLDGRGIEVEFFGERTTLPAGPATLGIRTGAPILPTAVYFTPRYNGHFGLVRPPLDTTRSGSLRDDVARITQQLARDLELLITRAPQQWHMFQPNWPSDPGYQKSPSRRRQRVTQVGSRRAARAWTLCAVRSPVPSTVMAGLGAVRWGRARDGRRHLVQTRARFLGRPGVTPVSMCGVDIETLTRPGTAWDESSPLACAQCTRARAESISDASSAPPE